MINPCSTKYSTEPNGFFCIQLPDGTYASGFQYSGRRLIVTLTVPNLLHNERFASMRAEALIDDYGNVVVLSQFF